MGFIAWLFTLINFKYNEGERNFKVSKNKELNEISL